MAETYKFISDINVRQQNWTSKVIVAEKYVAKTSHNHRTRYQNMVLIDMQPLYMLPFSSHFRKFPDVLGVVIDMLPKKIVQTKYNTESCIQDLVLVNEKAKVRVQVQDYTGLINANMIGDTAESFMQCSSQRLMEITEQGYHNILTTIRTHTEKEHFLYLKAMKNSNKSTNMRYDVIFMLDSMLDTEITTNEEELPVTAVILQENFSQPPENNISYSSVKDTQPHTFLQFSKEFGVQDNTNFILPPDIARHNGSVYGNNYK
ncbi:Nucleic acid-binding [Forsythia ovata]|uniref:Nucleic acid-binding n=2 Tax=Forsythia ovata TaxID=205694 RepID=A0ABD1WCF4_9LAMI